ncbi:hypothetical protein L1987_03428 [Smallanthus sonchifolius]|uniref:Uncharacterized protein n=1 Tax=Smallanthus sonchifolius TaxID=185202 RepID=A0ACB9KAM4_9ASTR|nr:hypothetical protein L1987_03428 [Smallanthus sonchifolius]
MVQARSAATTCISFSELSLFFVFILLSLVFIHDSQSVTSSFASDPVFIHGFRQQSCKVQGSIRHKIEVLSSSCFFDLKFIGAPVEDLCLDFTLPGYPNFILKPYNEDLECSSNWELFLGFMV